MAGNRPRRPPATTPEGREREVGAKAFDLAERQIEDGSASAQVITHFLKAVSTREAAELGLIQRRAEMLEAQKEALAAQARTEVLVAEALEAMKRYSGNAGAPEIEHGID
jgi:hypothetical protein